MRKAHRDRFGTAGFARHFRAIFLSFWPFNAPAFENAEHPFLAIGHQFVQIGLGPAQGIEAAQHVVADGDIDGTQLIGIKRKHLAVERRGEEAGNSPDLAAVAVFGQAQQARIGMGCALA